MEFEQNASVYQTSISKLSIDTQRPKMVVKNAKKYFYEIPLGLQENTCFLMKNTCFVKTYLSLSFAARVFFVPKVLMLVKEKYIFLDH